MRVDAQPRPQHAKNPNRRTRRKHLAGKILSKLASPCGYCGSRRRKRGGQHCVGLLQVVDCRIKPLRPRRPPSSRGNENDQNRVPKERLRITNRRSSRNHRRRPSSTKRGHMERLVFFNTPLTLRYAPLRVDQGDIQSVLAIRCANLAALSSLYNPRSATHSNRMPPRCSLPLASAHSLLTAGAPLARYRSLGPRSLSQ